MSPLALMKAVVQRPRLVPVMTGVPAGQRARLAIRTADRWKGIGLSIALHAVLFGVGSWLWVQPVNYGVSEGVSAVEVQLVAAPAQPKAAVAQEKTLSEPQAVVVPPTPEAALPEPEKAEVKKIEPPAAVPAPPVTGPRGDGSSTVPGQDAVSQRASAGAQIAARPNYLKNPSPVYPEASRRRGEQGVVWLTAQVDRSGKPLQVNLFKSSGHRDLDASALKSVKRWVFEPARVGTLPVESTVQIPVRFRLSDSTLR